MLPTAWIGRAVTVVGDTLLTVVEKEPGSVDVRFLIDGKAITTYRSESMRSLSD